jgi:hypothetical protein
VQEEPLAADALDGLDSATAEALARVGVTTLDQLARCEALALSSRAGLAYTRLLRLALLARRERAARAPRPPGPSGEDLLQPAPPRARPVAPGPGAEGPRPDPRFSPSEGPPVERPEPLAPLAAPRVDRRAAAGAPQAAPPDGSLESAGPFA